MSEKLKNLLIRTATGVVFVAVVLGAMLLGKGSYFWLLLFVGGLCSVEFVRLARGGTQKWLGVTYIVLCMVAMWFFPLLGGGMADDTQLWRENPLLSEGFPAGWDARIAPAFIVIVWANDIFAYLVGVTVGRHKMCPTVSPRKSWEGFAGGIVGATVVAGLVARFWTGGGVWLWAIFGLLVALDAVAGDLVESRFKRAAGVKDSGRLLPGHGGMLDRFDATLGAVPVAFLFLLITHLTR
jgi:CDP-diglyceride synthetase